jgi:glycosyltransferase involved in cell wall biosynthesis
MKQPLVSICIPTYKQITYLKKCIESVLKQDFEDYELIITDDSPDDSIKNFLKVNLKNKTYFYKRNNPALGSPENWNSALRLAKGKYIKLMHHDDFFTQANSLRLMVEKLEVDKTQFLFCQTDVWYTKSNTHRIHQPNFNQLKIIKSDPAFLFFKNMIGAPSATIFLNLNQQFDKQLKWLVDVDFYIRYLNAGSFSYFSEPLICTSHDIEGQITGEVLHDKIIQIREHVLVFNKLGNNKNNSKSYEDFFDDLFYTHSIITYSSLCEIVPEAITKADFYKKVLKNSLKNRFWKKWKKKFFTSRYNNYIFKLEQFK